MDKQDLKKICKNCRWFTLDSNQTTTGTCLQFRTKFETSEIACREFYEERQPKNPLI